MGLFFQVYSTSKAQDQIKDYETKFQYLIKYKDSIYSELEPAQIELNRHIEALHIFLKRNPKAAEEYANIISNETE